MSIHLSTPIINQEEYTRMTANLNQSGALNAVANMPHVFFSTRQTEKFRLFLSFVFPNIASVAKMQNDLPTDHHDLILFQDRREGKQEIRAK